MGKKLGPAEWEQIVMNRTYGMNNAKNAETVGVSTASITSTLAAFDAVKDQDWAKCCNIIVTYDTVIEVFNWAGQKTGRQIPPIIQQSYEKWREEKRRLYVYISGKSVQPMAICTESQLMWEGSNNEG